MYVGSPRKPQKGECELCRQLREALESMDDDRGDGEGKGESTGGRADGGRERGSGYGVIGGKE